jgi:hypothetical protein
VVRINSYQFIKKRATTGLGNPFKYRFDGRRCSLLTTSLEVVEELLERLRFGGPARHTRSPRRAQPLRSEFRRRKK